MSIRERRFFDFLPFLEIGVIFCSIMPLNMPRIFKEERVKMDFLFSGVFWGVVLIILGLSVIINMIFHVHIPVFRILFALIIIYIGIRVLTGGGFHPFKPDKNTIMFGETTVNDLSQKQYNVVFGKGNFDLSNVKASGGTTELNTIFGATEIVLPAGVPAKLSVDSAFAGAQLPDGSTVSFGSSVWKTQGFDETKPHISLKISVVFGGLQVRQAK